jgi:hypothetical protein
MILPLVFIGAAVYLGAKYHEPINDFKTNMKKKVRFFVKNKTK